MCVFEHNRIIWRSEYVKQSSEYVKRSEYVKLKLEPNTPEDAREGISNTLIPISYYKTSIGYVLVVFAHR